MTKIEVFYYDVTDEFVYNTFTKKLEWKPF